MDNSIQKSNPRSLTAERLSQNVTVQNLAAKKFDKTSDTLPAKIDQAFDVPKIWEMSLATSEENVIGFIEFELIKLAERINVSGNLTDIQIQSIASNIVREFRNETIADFKICFERAANGVYGKIFKLDGIEVGQWIKSYLDEKYKVLEDNWYKEKDQYKNDFHKSDTDWLQLWADAIKKTDEEGGVKTKSQNITFLQNLRALSDKEIREQGQVDPKIKTHRNTSTHDDLILNQLIVNVRSELYQGKRDTNAKLQSVGEFQIYAESAEDARIILSEAQQRLSVMTIEEKKKYFN